MFGPVPLASFLRRRSPLTGRACGGGAYRTPRAGSDVRRTAPSGRFGPGRAALTAGLGVVAVVAPLALPAHPAVPAVGFALWVAAAAALGLPWEWLAWAGTSLFVAAGGATMLGRDEAPAELLGRGGYALLLAGATLATAQSVGRRRPSGR